MMAIRDLLTESHDRAALTVRIPRGKLERLDALCAALRLKRSAVVREALNHAIGELEALVSERGSQPGQGRRKAK